MKKKLGRGIENFLSSDDKFELKNPTREILIDDILPNINQPRKDFDEKSIEELANSIKNHGILQPLILRKEADKYLIVAGERRYRAAIIAGLKKLPATVMDIDQADILNISLIENIQRQDLNPIEEAMCYREILREFDMTQEDLSKKIGKSRQYIGNAIRLLNLDEEVVNLIRKGELSPSHGKVLLSEKDKKKQFGHP